MTATRGTVVSAPPAPAPDDSPPFALLPLLLMLLLLLPVPLTEALLLEGVEEAEENEEATMCTDLSERDTVSRKHVKRGAPRRDMAWC